MKEVHVHHASLRAYVRSSFPSVHDVDDVVQESYLRIWRRHAVAPIEFTKAFLFSVARRLAVDCLRRQKSSVIETVENLAALSADAGLQRQLQEWQTSVLRSLLGHDYTKDVQ